MLTVFTVSNLDDSGAGSLREAIGFANDTPGSDTIDFYASLSGETIELGGTELEITESLTIGASALDQPVTIDANQQSRVLNFNATTGDLTLRNLTITGGDTTGSAGSSGGGIRFGKGSDFTGTFNA